VSDPIYLDHAATTPVAPRVVAAAQPYFSQIFANPASRHRLGQAAQTGLDHARVRATELFGCARDEIVFTGSASEANNLALKGLAWASKKKVSIPHLVTSSVEHPCIIECCAALEKHFGVEVTKLRVDGDGRVDPDELKKAIKSNTVLVSIMTANNEVGTENPIVDLARIAREAGVPFHTDAVAAACWIDLRPIVKDAAMASISAHKMYGPKGVGVLKVSRATNLVPLVHGGGQEMGLRSGTESVPAIVGAGEAFALCTERRAEAADRVRTLRDRLAEGILSQVRGVRWTGHPKLRVANHASFVFESLDGKALIDGLSTKGVIASSGSACSSRKLKSSHVLRAMGISDELASASLRLTLGVDTTQDEIDRTVEILGEVVREIRPR
jgi:cysteine desulfurase